MSKKLKEIEEAFVSISYLAKTNPDECIDKLERYYDEFQSVVTETKKVEMIYKQFMASVINSMESFVDLKEGAECTK